MSMSQERQAGPPPAPVITDTKRVNCPFIISEPDEVGNREVSFIVGPAQLETFVISPDGGKEFLKAFSGGIETADLSDLREATRS